MIDFSFFHIFIQLFELRRGRTETVEYVTYGLHINFPLYFIQIHSVHTTSKKINYLLTRRKKEISALKRKHFLNLYRLLI